MSGVTKKYLSVKPIYFTDEMIEEIKRQMPIHRSKYFSHHVRKALEIGLEILKEKEAQMILEYTTEKESIQP